MAKYVVVFQVEHNATYPYQAMVNIRTAIEHACKDNDSKLLYYGEDKLKDEE
jgi:hypothetical protein